MILSLLFGDLAPPTHLFDQRVVTCEPLEDAVTQAVRARIADMADNDLLPLRIDRYRRDGRAHSRKRGIGVGLIVNRSVGDADRGLKCLCR